MVRLSNLFKSIFPSTKQDRGDNKRRHDQPDIEGTIITALGQNLVAAADFSVPAWVSLSAVFTPGREQVKFFGFIYSDRPNSINTDLLDDETVLLVNKLKYDTVFDRGDWQRIIIRIIRESDVYDASYDFSPTNPWNIFGCENDDELNEMIEKMRKE